MPLTLASLIVLSFLFMFVELKLSLSKRSGSVAGTIRADRGSLFVIWITITLSFTAGFNLAYYGKWNVINYLVGCIGLCLYLTGMIIRWVSVKQLDSAFTVDVAVTDSQALKTDGLYSKVRHPSYLGALMIITGIAFGMNTVLSFLTVTIPVVLSFMYRIYVEEKLLREAFGEKYAEYSMRTWKLIPYIY